MLEEILNTTVSNTSITLQTIMLTVICSFGLGIILLFTYQKTNEEEVSDYFPTVIMLLPVVMSTVILLIGNNIAGAFSLAGIFSIIRFRSAPGNTRDIMYILFCVGIGLACGIEAYFYAAIFTCIICFVLFVQKFFGRNHQQIMQLKILIPEDLNDVDVFEDIFKNYTTTHKLYQINTKDLGSVYELNYTIALKNNIDQKEFIDQVRCRNGNLNISLSIKSCHSYEF